MKEVYGQESEPIEWDSNELDVYTHISTAATNCLSPVFMRNSSQSKVFP